MIQIISAAKNIKSFLFEQQSHVALWNNVVNPKSTPILIVLLIPCYHRLSTTIPRPKFHYLKINFSKLYNNVVHQKTTTFLKIF